jgi:hypothetical protein
VVPTKCKDAHGWSDCIDRFIRVVKQTDMMHVVLVEAIVGPANLVSENAAWNRTDSLWLVNHQVDSDTYCTVC